MPEGFGLFAIGWTLFRLFTIAGHLGLDSGIIKFGGKYWINDRLKLKSVLLISLSGAFLSGTFFGIILYINAPWLSDVFFKKSELTLIFRGFAFAFPFATTLRVLAASNSLSGKMLCGAIAEDIAQPIIQIILFLVLFRAGMNINAAILSVCISYGLSVLTGLVCVAKSIPSFFYLERLYIKDLLPLLKYSFPAIIGVTLGAFNLWGDRIIVGYFSTKTLTGIYQSISILAMFTTTLLSGFKIALAPTISHMYHNKNLNGIEMTTKSAIRWSLYISMPILIFICINANSLIVHLFGKDYQTGFIPLLILSVGQVTYMTFGIADQIFLMTDNQKEWVWISMVTFTLTVMLDAIFIPRMDLIGASIVSSAMTLLLGLLALTRLRRLLNFYIIDIYHLKILTISTITALISYFIISRLELVFLLSAVVSIIIICTVYILLLLFSGINKEDKLIFYKFIKTMPHP
jgi:O-antigen/teichoic acid export membrane protein